MPDLYDFNQADTTSGTMPTPAGLPTLQQISGAWRIASQRPVTDASPGTNPILAASSGSGNVDISALCSYAGGDCLYVRVSDANNWIRLRVRRWATSGSYSYYTTSYLWRQDYAIGWGHSPLVGSHYATSWTTSNYPPYFASSITHGHYGYDPNNYYSDNTLHTHYASGSPYVIDTRQEWHSGTTTRIHYGVYLEKCEAGAITVLASQEVNDRPNALRLRCNDASIEAFLNGSATPTLAVSETFNQNVGTQGIGLGDSDYLGSGLDNLSVDVLNTTSNTPGVVAPLDGANITSTQPFTFEWIFDDPDVGDYQTGFVLRYRKVGDTTWTTVSQTTANQFWTAPADTFAVSQQYEWSVHTLDSASDPSPDTPVMRFRAVGYGNAILGGAKTPVLGANVIVGGVEKPVERMSVIVGGAPQPVG